MLYGVYTVYDLMRKIERGKLFEKQLKTAHNALHVIKFANRLYRVTVLYNLYYPKLKQTH